MESAKNFSISIRSNIKEPQTTAVKSQSDFRKYVSYNHVSR